MSAADAIRAREQARHPAPPKPEPVKPAKKAKPVVEARDIELAQFEQDEPDLAEEP